MAPGPQEHSPRVEARAPREDAPPADSDVVISGMSGLLPGCHNVDEFARKLYNKENLVKKYEYRWEYEHPEIPEWLGRVPGLAHFDAQFFKVHYRLAQSLDAMARKVMENAYQAIFDAGLSPTELSSKRVGVFLAVGSSETEKASPNSYIVSMGLVGANRAMIANRVSYCLNLTGPSLVMDGSCAGSLAVFEKAYQSITSGQCDAALVGASKVLLHPHSVIHYHRVVPKNNDGKTKSYDTNADGQSLSEAIIVFVLQRYKDSKRVYASLCYAKSSFGVEEDFNLGYKFKHERDPQHLVKFLQEFYREAGIPPSVVEYVEGFGAAVPVTDKMELQAIEEVFCKDRANPLLVGSVMSNIGYTEAASGSAAIMKILLAYKRGELASNLHCESPRQDIAALREGRMRIVTDHHRFRRCFYAAVNGMSITGLNGHALFRGYFKPKDLSRYYSEIPYLVTISGRQELAVQKLINNLKTHSLDAEEISLLHNLHKHRMSAHLARGFGIFSTNEDNKTVTRCEAADYYDDARRPLWFVYSGMGSQWAGMGTQLLRIPVFAAAIERCRKVLEPKGVDLLHILTSPDKSIYDNVMHSFVGISAVQIGLTDVLTSIGLIPDNIIGHSVGELGCAYADGCLTAEEMILAAYSRGQVSLETTFIVGSMAAVGLGYEQVLKICPPEIDVACHNGPESSTISGPVAVMHEFIAHLISKGIFAKEVPCSNIAYHSRYIAKAGPGLLQYLGEVITTPRLRSERWVSTSVPQDRWQENIAKYSSAEYHTNNLLNPVLFEETARLIPSNAVVVEIAPHGLLQAILKKSLPVGCENIAITRRDHADNTLFLLEAIGRIYMKGYDVDLAALYPPVEFPVSTETPMLSHLLGWVHDVNWSLSIYVTADRRCSTVYKPIITIYDDEYLAGHIIGGTRLFPIAGALVAVWDTLAMTLSKPLRSLPVKYHDIRFHAQPCLLTNEPLRLTVSLLRGSGHFEVSYEYGLIAEGEIRKLYNKNVGNVFDVQKKSLSLTSVDVYKLLQERGYEYRGEFRSIHKTNCSVDQAQLIWDSNWVTFIDGLIQLNVLRRPHAAISQPSHIETLTINPAIHLHSTGADANYIHANLIETKEVTECGGVTIKGISFVDKPYIMRQTPAFKTLQFFPFFLEEDADIMTTLYVFMQIIAENITGGVLNIFDIICYKNTRVIENLKNILNSPPEIKHEVIRINKRDLLELKNKTLKPDVLVVHDLLSDKHMFEILYQYLPTNTFIVSVGVETQELYPALYRPVCARGKGTARIELALWRPSPSTSTTALTVRNPSEIDFLQSTCSTLPPQHTIVVLTCYPPPLGLKYIVKQQRKISNRKINVAMIDHKLTDEKDLDHLPRFVLTYNLLNNGEWGGDYYLPLPKTGASGRRRMALQSAQIGNLDSLKWVEVPERVNKGVAITVHFAALSTYDTKRARADIPISNENDGYGMDFSGITDSGHRVFGVVQSGALSSRVNGLKELLWPVPDHWDLEDAATVALPYLQAFYCLAIKCQVREGMRILIHGGAGALGQAAISIALAIRCEVFTTVSDIRKMKFLKKIFPYLKGSHIGNSRDNTFSDMVLSATNGAGCDVVINNLQGELKNASLSCCADFGVTLDICQIHMRENFSYGMFNMSRNRTYIPIDFSLITKGNNLEELQKLQLLVSEGIATGCVRPLSRVAYAPHEAARAFRLLAASNHRGRVLLRMDHASLASLAQLRLACSDELQHLLICDDEVLSLQLVDRLINRGAKRLRLYFPKSSAYLKFKKDAWHCKGVQVETTYGETWDKEKLIQFLHESKQAGLVESLFFIVRDYEHESMMKSTLQSLDIASRELFHSLKHFTVISENRFFGRDICYDRALCGLPSLSLQLLNLEKFDELGYNNNTLSTVTMKWLSAVEIIERALCSREAVVFGYAQAMTNRTLLEEIALLPGVSITSSTDPRSTLEQVGVDQGRAQELCYMLQEKFDVVLPKEILSQMTITQLKKIQEQFSSTTKEDSGIKAYFQTIDEDELVASTELVLMRTLGSSSEMHLDEFDMTQTYLCIIPGVEGHKERFGILCERLKLPALVLQPSSDTVFDNIRDMAQRLVDVMTQSLKNRETFYLLGYELGILVALEMAAILERYGLTGTVFCLGGTSEDIRTSLEMDLGEMSEETLQNALLQHLTALLGYKDQNLIESLQKGTNMEEKIEICVNRNRKSVTYTSQFTRCYLKAAYNRIQLIRNHKSQAQSLRSKIVVMRAELPGALNLNSMAGFSQQPIIVHDLRASLAQAPKNLQCSTIINQHLDSELLEAFKSRNLCDTYSIDNNMVINNDRE